MDSLEKMFDPKSIAIIGASDHQDSIGQALMKNLVGSGYSGSIYPVNPKRKSVFGIHCYRSVGQVPEKIDLAIIATPSFTVPKIARQCVSAGVKSIIVISSGFSEIGTKGINLEKELKQAIAGTGIRLLGPNCLGYIRPDKKINASFAIRNALPGKLALVSQSGALCSGILDWAQKENVGFKYFISIGGMLDIGFGDIIDFLEKDTEIESIIVYMESVKNPEKFLEAAKKFAKKKPIIVAKSGRFEESAKAAVSHTGAMAGNDEVFDAAFRSAGIVRVEGIQDLLSCSEAFSKQPVPKGNRILVITNAGGPGVMATDAIIKNKCRLAFLSRETMRKLNRVLPKNWSHNNPVDILGDASPERYAKAFETALKEKNSDCIIVILTPQAISRPDEVAKKITEKAKNSGKTILASWIGENFVESGREILQQNNIPCFETPEEAVRVFSYMNQYRENIKNIYQPSCEIPAIQRPNREKISAVIKEAIKQKRAVLNEMESKEILKAYGIPVNETLFAKTNGEASQKARQIGFPVAMKIVSNEITHKTDAKGVALNLVNEKEAEKAFLQIVSGAKKFNPKAKIAGVTVQKMIDSSGLELIIGEKTDVTFGKVLLFGLGGTATEIYQDKSLELIPLTKNAPCQIVQRTKVYSLLKGYRNKFKADLAELAGILEKFSNFANDFKEEIEEADINPLLISNGKLIAVDARIVLASRQKTGK
ncbi:MAG: acetate--CoA ligase family protein [Candidatus ainarchaeum sp.]|nr:acetate--CoA ligase family protein [Candidatus ainarchaeum sp.]